MTKAVPEIKIWETDRALHDFTRTPVLYGGEERAFASVMSNDLRGKKVLDLGCGGGRTSGFLRDMGGEVVGMDISHRLIAAAQSRFQGIDFHVGDAASLPYPDNRFDYVLFSFNGMGCLYPIAARKKCIGEIKRVLRPGGVFIVSFHNLSAFIFGWYKFMRPWKLLFRIKTILRGNVFKKGCYIVEPNEFNMKIYYTWPAVFRSEMAAFGFETIGIYPNAPVLGWLQAITRTTAFTRMCDPWPYYALRKT